MTYQSAGHMVPERIFKALMEGPEKTALRVDGEDYSYSQLREAVFAFARDLRQRRPYRVGLLTHRSFETYQSLLGSLLSGITCVPLNPLFPVEKTAFIITHAQCSHVFIDGGCFDCAISMVEHLEPALLDSLTFIVSANTADQAQSMAQAMLDSNDCPPAKAAALRSMLAHMAVSPVLQSSAASRAETATSLSPSHASAELNAVSSSVGECEVVLPAQVQPDDIMHILYTSGTTGQPKGVMVSHGNYAAYLNSILELYQYNSSDVFSHFAEITFDISLQDPLSALISGGTVVCPSARDLMMPHRYLQSNGITVVHTVPSLVSYMQKTKVLDKVCIDSVRITLFLGEALWYHQARMYHKAFPYSRLINTYGPTETTVAVSYYEVTFAELDDPATEHAIVPLGRALPGVELAAADAQGHFLPDGVQGELLIGGEQVTPGYWNNKEKNEQAFISIEGRRWYRTGDLVSMFTAKAKPGSLQAQGVDTFSTFHYIGRNDDMVKITGYRISFYEVEEGLGKLTDRPVRTMKCTELMAGVDTDILVAVIEGADADEVARISRQSHDVLATYMVPKYVVSAPSFPLNSNGKVDRRALKEMVINQASELIGKELKG